MAYGLVLVFEGTAESEYWAVNEALGINRDGTGDWPEGLQVHTGGVTDDGGLVVSEVWDSKESQEAFMTSRLGPALGKVGVSPPVQTIETTVVNSHTR